MRILYVTTLDPNNYIAWSGLTKNIFDCLKKTSHNIKKTGPIRSKVRYIYIVKRIFYKLFNLKYDADRKICLSKIYAKKIKVFLNQKNYDLIVTSDTYTVSYLETDVPIIIWTDLTYKSWVDNYFKKKNILENSYLEANYLEKLALDKAHKIFLTSNWAIKDAIKNYGNSAKFNKLEFGSNLNFKLNKDKFLKNLSDKKRFKICNVISIGVDWKRKGMDTSIKVVDYMNKIGCKTHLTIVGSNQKAKSKNLSVINFLDKNNNKQKKKLINLIQSSHFNILMSKAEGYGVVFIEASSLGLYNIAYNVGGVSGAIKNNFNGKLFNKKDNYKVIARYLVRLFNNKENYNKKSISSYNYYHQNINWTSISDKFNKMINNLIKK